MSYAKYEKTNRKGRIDAIAASRRVGRKVIRVLESFSLVREGGH
ncbi:hypothetical protein [Nostoc piscinale]